MDSDELAMNKLGAMQRIEVMVSSTLLLETEGGYTWLHVSSLAHLKRVHR